MNVSVGKIYHLKDSFFSLVNDSKLMANKENGNYRPHFFFIADPEVNGIYWAIPQSSRVEKYRKLLTDKIAKYGRCNTIIIDRVNGRESAFLIQNMFPITEKYVDHEHMTAGRPSFVHKKLAVQIKENAEEVLLLHQKGKRVVFPDIDRIYNMMRAELEEPEKSCDK